MSKYLCLFLQKTTKNIGRIKDKYFKTKNTGILRVWKKLAADNFFARRLEFQYPFIFLK